ncbi:uncharacterized protein EURHEDRAFT_401601 [Aspergillus ruber CBS 135680]|uniref:Uncharacterized protein n=1 Tax=Aspergillus ruber (strain CBS 135680) TaxID=1388766 RepID=A0A017SHX8_ASPRC|nr:uncharacterized protein EURHEDRAFT_401601 [Aspergillus ruber CBS 135680]EYE96537.1 hypothetical protein EURHEDRAFT_401601 [Aspergillus ruber CBS 135680]
MSHNTLYSLDAEKSAFNNFKLRTIYAQPSIVGGLYVVEPRMMYPETHQHFPGMVIGMSIKKALSRGLLDFLGRGKSIQLNNFHSPAEPLILTNQPNNSQNQYQPSQSTATNEAIGNYALEPSDSSQTGEAPVSLKGPVQNTHTEEQGPESEKCQPSNIIDDLAGIGA